jgi:hypothetical protein
MQSGCELDEWLLWAEQQADRLDPLTESPPSILDELASWEFILLKSANVRFRSVAWLEFRAPPTLHGGDNLRPSQTIWSKTKHGVNLLNSRVLRCFWLSGMV